MNVLIACEYSGIVRDAFIKKGHNAISCDILSSESSYGRHFQCDIRDVIFDAWDLMIAFPPCTHLASSGAAWFKYKQHLQPGAIAFVKMLYDCHIEKVAIENPVGILSNVWRKPDQIIQPYNFGDDGAKSTCLWLKNLPMLEDTGPFISPRITPNGFARWANQRDCGRLIERGKEAARFWPGVAHAMADQWG